MIARREAVARAGATSVVAGAASALVIGVQVAPLGSPSALGTTAAAASPAVPNGVGDLNCDPGEICMWRDDGMTGCFNDLRPENADSDYENGTPTWNNCAGHMGDQISSFVNRSTVWMIWYANEDFDTWWGAFCAAPGSSSKNLANFGGIPSSPEDTFSSHQTGAAPGGSDPDTCTWIDND